MQVDVELDCQRCGEPFKQTLECHFMYSPVANWDQLMTCRKFMSQSNLMSFGEIDLLGAVEDELILALSALFQCIHLNTVKCPRHEQVFGELPEELAKKPNPFCCN